ncbi:MAG: 1-acyl-sn-glycerol-3-phosphate acyltransferase [Flavobacteriales bacterium]|nr:1-acyl-sn-glycerol-3-phosphate acyltransferase [Flavobacteriales bacterium]
MKYLLIPINIVQILIIVLWTAVCGILGMLLMLITRNGQWVHWFDGRILWSPLVCAVSFVRVKIHGAENIDPTKARIYVANHESHYDIVALSRVMPIGLFFIAKKELSKVPVMGQYMRYIGHIFVDRGNKEAAKKSMIAAAEKIKSGRNVISFPEGTRSKTGEIGIFKRGSFVIAKEGGIDIVPIAIKGSREVLKSGTYSIFPGTIHVYIGDVIRVNELADLDSDQLAHYTREKIISIQKSV